MLKAISRFKLILVLAGSCIACQSIATPKTEAETNQLPDLSWFASYEYVSAPKLSHDEKYLAYQVDQLDMETTEAWQPHVWLHSFESGESNQLFKGQAGDWSPAQTSLLYYAEDETGATQLFVYDVASSKSRQLTSSDQSPYAAEWSPNGEKIAFKRFVAANGPMIADQMESLVPPSADGVERPPQPIVINHVHHERTDAGGVLPAGYDHVFVLDLASSQERQITQGEWYANAFEAGNTAVFDDSISWSADSSKVYFSANRSENWDKETHRAQILSASISGGDVREIVGDTDDGYSFFLDPKVAPGGSKIAFTGYRWSEYHMRRVRELWMLDLQTNSATQLTMGSDAGIWSYHWSESGDAIRFQVESHLTRDLYEVSVDDPDLSIRRITDFGMRKMIESLVPFEGGQKFVGVAEAHDQPRQIALYDTSSRRTEPLTKHNLSVDYSQWIGDLHIANLTSADGTEIQAWLQYPKFSADDEPIPLLIDLHGGPNMMDTPFFDPEILSYLQAGFAVLEVNYRGSTGYGEEFANASFYMAERQQSYEDVIAATEWATKQPNVSSINQFISGSSAGGDRATWAITRSNRFTAAVAHHPSYVNRISNMGTADEAAWANRRFENSFLASTEQAMALWETSPVAHARKIKTPLLIIAGDADARAHFTQSLELFRAVKLSGDTPVRLVRMPGKGHYWYDDFATFVRIQNYTIDWLQKWMAEPETN